MLMSSNRLDGHQEMWPSIATLKSKGKRLDCKSVCLMVVCVWEKNASLVKDLLTNPVLWKEKVINKLKALQDNFPGFTKLLNVLHCNPSEKRNKPERQKKKREFKKNLTAPKWNARMAPSQGHRFSNAPNKWTFTKQATSLNFYFSKVHSVFC